MIVFSATGTEPLRVELKDRQARLADFSPLMKAIGLTIIRSTHRTFHEGGRPSKWPVSMRVARDGGSTMLKSGASGLLGSITAENDRKSVTVGTNKIYGRLMQLGGIIQPKTKKALTIPLTEAAGKAAERVSSVREIPDLQFRPSKGGGPSGNSIGVLGKVAKGTSKKKKYNKGDFLPMFALMRKVKIPPRPFLLLQREDIDYILEEYKKFLAGLK